jgi:hypothetical protein
MTIVAGIAVIDIVLNFTEMFVIHPGLNVLMAVEAGELFAIGRIVVAFHALLPLSLVFPGKDREELRVVVREFTLPAIQMAEQTIGALISITRYPLMRCIHLRLCMLVTGQAGELLTVRRIVVTRKAFCPLPCVSSGEDGKKLYVVVAEITAFSAGMAAEA